MTLERWQRLTSMPLIVASVLFIIAYSLQVILDLQGVAHTVADAIMTATWVIFAVDYGVRLALAPHRAQWFRTHLFDFVVVVLPALRPLRLLKALTVVRTLHRTAGAALRSNIALYGVSAAGILIWIASLAVLDAERRDPDANIVTFIDAMWWSFVTITTVGYGDFYPVTLWGRIVAVLLMCGGVAVVGVVTATLASWVIETAAARGDDDQEAATRGQIRRLSEQIAALSRTEPGPPTSEADGRPPQP